MNERWEYKIVHILADLWTGTGLPNDLNQQFDEFGADGWELISTESITRSSWLSQPKTVAIVGFFKRLREE